MPESPNYERETTPPFLWAPTPPTTEILTVRGNDMCGFNVLVKSEDAPGDDLWAYLYLNYRIPGREERQPGKALAPAATLSDPARTINFEWLVPMRSPAAREQLSLIVSHSSNFQDYLPLRDDDVAILTWWVDITETAEGYTECRRSGGAP